MRFTIPAVIALAILLPTVLPAAPAAVTVSEDENSFSLDNGIITARVSKHSGDLVSLEYKSLQMLDAGSGRQEAYWSHNAARAAKIIPLITIDPKNNGGKRGEVSVKGVS